jgi:PAS domain-containing protein
MGSAGTFALLIFNFVKEHAADFKLFFGELIKRRLLVLLSLVLLGATIALGFVYWDRASNYEAIINGTLVSETESTSQNFKGLESFIFSNIPSGVNEALAKRPVNPALIEKFKTLQTKLQKIVTEKQIPDEIKKGIFVDIPQGASGDVFTDARSAQIEGPPGYLFLPSYLIRRSSDIVDQKALGRGKSVRFITHTPATQAEKRNLQDPLIEDGGLATDVAFGRLVAESLQQMTGLSITDDTQSVVVSKYLQPEPVQVYLITTSGTNRIFNQRAYHPDQLYGNQFPANTFFPDRPYFWPTFLKRSATSFDQIAPKDGSLIEDFFYVSRPYLDLGGSGVVITLTKGIKIQGLPQAVICIDIQFSTQAGLYTSLENLVKKMSGYVFKVSCSVPSNSAPTCDPADHSRAANLNETEREMLGDVTLKVSLAKERAARSLILGSLQVLKTNGSNVRFSLPVDQDFSSSIEKTTLMVIDIDINDYRRRTTLIALLATGCLIGMISILGSVWTLTAREKNENATALSAQNESLAKRATELETAFQQVAKVMFHSPTAYVRLDSQDRIVDLSASFCMLLGIPSAEIDTTIPELKGRKFKSFCADAPSLAKYAEVEDKRIAGKEVGEYELNLAKIRGGFVRTKIFSATVPSDHLGELPQTFGILIDLTGAALATLEGEGRTGEKGKAAGPIM